MTVQAKIEASTLMQAMAAAFGEIEGATKASSGQVGQQKYRYADLTSVIDAIKPALISHSLFFTQRPQQCEGGVMIETVLHHAGGESMELGRLFVPANKNDAQAFGSALTYARRYALVTAFGVPVEDDDGNAASKAAPAKAEPAISDEQLEKLELMIPAAKLTPAQFCRTMGCAKVSLLPASKFQEAMNRINERMAVLAKQATNKEAVNA